ARQVVLREDPGGYGITMTIRMGGDHPPLLMNASSLQCAPHSPIVAVNCFSQAISLIETLVASGVAHSVRPLRKNLP
ncbi:MAG: hypothetical protein WA539_20320, partial [Candidatus Sulfotelmatobacter sp.]